MDGRVLIEAGLPIWPQEASGKSHVSRKKRKTIRQDSKRDVTVNKREKELKFGGCLKRNRLC